MSYSFTPAAREEFLGAMRWYLADGGQVPAEFFEHEVDRALRLLDFMPRLGTPGYGGTRTWPVRDFPYTVVYRVEADDGISVIAVAHQSREPGYWRGRT